MARRTCVGLRPRRWQMDRSRLPLAASDPGSCCLATFVCFHLQDQSNWPAFQLPASDTPPLANGITQWTPGVNKRQDGWMNKCPLSFIDRRVLSSACRGSLFLCMCVCDTPGRLVGEKKRSSIVCLDVCGVMGGIGEHLIRW